MTPLAVPRRCPESQWRAVEQDKAGVLKGCPFRGRVWSLRRERCLGRAVRLSEHRAREDQAIRSAGETESRPLSLKKRAQG